MDSSLDQYASPYGGIAPDEETPQEKIQYFLEDHGKKILVVLILLVVGFFVWDFFVGSYRNVTLEIKNTEGERVTGNITITRVGESNPVYTGPTSAQSLKAGTYNVEVMADGYLPIESETITINQEGETISFLLQKALATRILEVTFPNAIYLGQDTTASLVLQNTGTKPETIELVFDGDFKDLLANGFSIQSEPATITVNGQSTTSVTLQISAPTSFTLKNTTTGDDKKGKIKIKFTSSSAAQKEVAFKLLPAPNVLVTPSNFTKILDAGSTDFLLGKITLQNKGKVTANNIQLRLELDSDAPPNATDWFAFDTMQVDALAPSEKQEIQVYLTTPLNSQEVKIAQQSHIIVSGENGLWEQSISLNITIRGIETAVNATLSPSDITVRKQADGSYETKPAKVSIKNNGDLTITNAELIALTYSCIGAGWIQFDQDVTVSNLLAGQSKDVSFLVSAPDTAPIDPTNPRTCEFKVDYIDPITGDEQSIDTSPKAIRIRTDD